MTARALSPGDPLSGGPDGGQVVVWATAATAALAVHLGIGAWMLHKPAEPAGNPAPPAMMLELAPMPAAPLAEAPELTQDVIDQIETPETTEAPDLLTPETPELPPPPEDLPEVAQDVPPPPDLTPVPVPEPEVAIPRPVTRPKPVKVEKKKEEKKEELRQARAPAPAAAEKPVGASNPSQGSPRAQAQWKDRLAAHLERRKRYPSAARSRKAEGTAQVRFTVDAGGSVLSAALVRSSGDATLDAEAVALLQRASPLPKPPDGTTHTVTAPINFTIRN